MNERNNGTFLKSLLISFLAFLLFPLLANSSPQEPLHLDAGLATISTPDGGTLYAEISDTPEKRRRGLMFRHSLAPDHGMLFTFQGLGLWTFWMKNTKISLDMIWMDKTGKVVDIHHAVPICERTDDFCPRYTPREKALAVLEIRAGMAKRLGLKPGDTLTITMP